MSLNINYIVNIGPKYQNSSASVNRVKAFQRGVKLNGNNCNIIFPYEKDFKNKFISKLVAIFNVFYHLIKAKKGDVFILYGISFNLNLLLLFRKKIKILVEITEYPYSIINSKYSNHSNKEIKLLKLLKNVNGFITCSEALKIFYSKYFINVPTFVSPIIVDVKKFQQKFEIVGELKSNSYIGYCGSLDNNKDGVPILIRSFFDISDKFPFLKLIIAGGGDATTMKELMNIIKELKLEEKVIFLGRVDHNTIPQFLQDACLLALARPNNKQAEGGIPSKIGEYLAVGVPTVVTSVGELPLFLKDGFNCYMAEPDSIESFSHKLYEGLTSPQRNMVVKNAIDTAMKFDISTQGDALVKFIKSIL